MAKLSISASEKILIVGSIYDKIYKINGLLDCYSKIIINGNLLYPNSNLHERINLVNKLLESNKVVYNLGSHDLKLLNKLYKTNENFDIQKWIIDKPNVINIKYDRFSVLIMNGGIDNNKIDINDSLEISFISTINNKPWHVFYNGLFGYIISNTPNSNQPTFYPYSMQLGTDYNSDLYAQEIDGSGLKETIKL